MKRFAVTALILLSACNPPNTASYSSYESPYTVRTRQQQEQTKSSLQTAEYIVNMDYKELSGEKPRSCSKEKYDRALRNVGSLLNFKPAGYSEYEIGLQTEVRRESARAMLNLAKLAQEKMCDSIARSIYLQVIETYEGSMYESFRQRAQIGLDELRNRGR